MLRSGKRCCVQRSNPVPSGLTFWTPYFLMYYCFWILLAGKKNTPIGHQKLISEQNALLLLLPETLLSVKTCHKMQHKIVLSEKQCLTYIGRRRIFTLKRVSPPFLVFLPLGFGVSNLSQAFSSWWKNWLGQSESFGGEKMKKKHTLTRTNFRDLQELAENVTRSRGKKTWEIEAPCGHFFDELHGKKNATIWSDKVAVRELLCSGRKQY